MKHRRFTILSALSLLLFSGGATIWMATLTRPAALFHRKGLVVWGIDSYQGGVTSHYATTNAADTTADGWHFTPHVIPLDPKAIRIPKLQWKALGFGFAHVAFAVKDGPTDYEVRIAAVPHWFLILLMAVLPASWTRRAMGRRQHARRLAAGLCPTCAYDLRASAERCPECSTPVPADLVRKPVV